VAAGAAHRGLAFALQKLRWNRISNSTKAGHQTSGTCPSREYPCRNSTAFSKSSRADRRLNIGPRSQSTGSELVDGSQNELEHLLLLRD
jgi:hypothetical protein